MFLKSVKRHSLRIRSITARLTLFYTLSTIILLSVATIFLYGGMLTILYTADQHFLCDEIDTIKKIMQKHPTDLLALREEIEETDFALSEPFYRYYIRLLDNQNHLVMETIKMDSIFKKADFFKKAATQSKESTWWKSAQGLNYLLMQAVIPAAGTQKKWVVQVALDISYQDTVIADYRYKIIMVILIGTLAALILGYFIARRGMRSLYDLTQSTKKITATSLDQRINPESWPNELHTLGMAFNQMLDRIEASFSRLTQFSDDLAHELRTPINNLMGEIEIVLGNTHIPPEYRQVLESTLEEAQRISHMIENLLFLARAENPKLDLKKVLLHAHEEIAVVIDFYQAMADEKNIRIVCEGRADLYANLIMFRRLISNILANALKHTPEQGTITFKISEVEHYRVQITLKDTGVGIDAEHLPQIFNRFYRVDESRTQHSGGLGLGLAIVKSIVDLHHGLITINSLPKLGTTIQVSLPK